ERRGVGHAEALAWPCAVGDRTEPISFSHGLGEASRVTARGGGSTIAVALDDVMAGWRPTLIKMDIEGSEIEALLGARASIAANRPSLAICVYHRPDHLWRVPLLLSSWRELDGYRYYLRAHAFDGFDTVLYANPSEVLS
ncbi:MAG TPA: FkbM family methyltransferase, partial [Vicinamibacterales bacterium]|nr:FkbM family methyltransferase [Vicinamibacterales bacterium]